MHQHNHSHHHLGNKQFILGASINIIFVAIEFTAGYWGNSLSLIGDAGHNLSDVMAIFIAWMAFNFAKQKPSSHFTYGYKSTTILAALINASTLLVVIASMVYQAIHRINSPQAVDPSLMIVVAGIGILVNGFTAWLFSHDRHHDLNQNAVYLHLLSDVFVSASVVITGVIIKNTEWYWLDPMVSLIIAGIILWSIWDTLIDSFQLALHAVPKNINLVQVKDFLTQWFGVTEVHDLHIWAMSTTETALTAHIVMPKGHPGDDELTKLRKEISKKFGISHATIQIELGNGSTRCDLEKHV